jgi:thiol:disulfide interchange protein
MGGAVWLAHDRFYTNIVVETPLDHSITWRPTFDIARREAQRTHKPMFVEFMASWCSDCRHLRETTLSDPAVMTALNTTVPVQIDVDAQPELARRYNVDAIPALLFVDPDTGGIIRDQRQTVLPAGEFLAWFNGSREQTSIP